MMSDHNDPLFIVVVYGRGYENMRLSAQQKRQGHFLALPFLIVFVIRWLYRVSNSLDLLDGFIEIDYFPFEIVLGFISPDTHEFLGYLSESVDLFHDFIDFMV